MLYAVKGNTERRIADDLADDYAKQGYDIYKEEKGKIVLLKPSISKVVAYEDYEKVVVEKEALEKELKALKGKAAK